MEEERRNGHTCDHGNGPRFCEVNHEERERSGGSGSHSEKADASRHTNDGLEGPNGQTAGIRSVRNNRKNDNKQDPGNTNVDGTMETTTHGIQIESITKAIKQRSIVDYATKARSVQHHVFFKVFKLLGDP